MPKKRKFWTDIDRDDDGKVVGVYLRDTLGEIVCWVDTEWEEDDMVAGAMASALVMGYTQGPDALRKSIGRP